MSKHNFWSDKTKEFLLANGRQDLVDKGDALAERVAALILTALNRLNHYAVDGDLYNGVGGENLLNDPQALNKLDEFVNTRLKSEIRALEKLLETFDDLKQRAETDDISILPVWY